MVLSRYVAAAALLATASTACAAPAAVHILAQAPASLVTAVTKTLAAQATTDPAYAIDANGCATLRASGGGNSLSACFGRRGVRFNVGSKQLRLRLTAFGRSGQLHAVHLTRGAPHANRIAYQTPGLREWWRALPFGYEQGFTLNKALAGHGDVVLQLIASAAPSARHGTLAWGSLRYGKLEVIDAKGRVLPAHLATHGRTVDLAFDARRARFPVTIDPMVWTQQELTASNGAADDQFGYAVALSGDGTTALVGANLAPYDSTTNTAGPGAAYVYVYDAATGTWTQTAELTAGNGAPSDLFGGSVALSADGTTALVGAPDNAGTSTPGPGMAYIYTKPNGGWATTSTYAAELTAGSEAPNESFGQSVALSADGTTALVGASGTTVGTNNDQGAAYVYTEPSGGWGAAPPTQTELIATNGIADGDYGWSVALSADGATALVGAPSTNAGPGAAYIDSYDATNRAWVQSAELTASGSGNFGWSGSLAGDGATALVADIGGSAAYIYTEPSGGWVTTSSYAAKLTASGEAAADFFGWSASLSSDGTSALVGAYNTTVGTNMSQGVAYVYSEPSGGWDVAPPTQTELVARSGTALGFFGWSVALSADGATALVGALNNSRGAAYLLTNSDLSTVLNAPAYVRPSGPYTVDYIVTNDGTTSSADLKVQLPIPSGPAYSNSSTTQGTCNYDSTSQIVTCDLGPLAEGIDATAELDLVSPVISGSSTQTGFVESSPDLAQSAVITVPAPPTIRGPYTATAPVVTLPTGLREVRIGNGGTAAIWFTLTGTGPLTATVAVQPDTYVLRNVRVNPDCNAAGRCDMTLTTIAQNGPSKKTTVTVTVRDTYGHKVTDTFVAWRAEASGVSPWTLLLLGVLGLARRRRCR